MENTPLELYETAYRLHYVENRLPEAISYYEALIKDFPDSNECGYAVIQIQKIKSNDLAEALAKRTSALHPLAIVALIMSFISIVGIVLCVLLYIHTGTIMEQKSALTMQALCQMNAGDYNEALKLLAQAKIIDKSDFLPFEMSSMIYRKLHQYEQARSEYEVFNHLNPGKAAFVPQMQPITEVEQPPPEKKAIQSPIEPASPRDTQAAAVQPPRKISPPPEPALPVIKAQHISAAPQKQPKRHQQPKPAKENHNISNPDSISYF